MDPRSFGFLLLAGWTLFLLPGGQAAHSVDSTATPEAPSDDVSFRCEIWPVLKKKCVQCHNPKKREGGLDMSTRETMLKGGHSGPAFVPGDVEKSLMIELIEFGEMPPRKQQKPRITESELKKLRKWIAAGAPVPDDPEPPAR